MSKRNQINRIGNKFVMQMDAPSGQASVVFEDDGDTGYFYALRPDEAAGQLEFLDALHIYNVEGEFRDVNIRLEVEWSEDSALAGLRVNASLWALFDFKAETGWSRNNFPPPAGKWRMGETRPDWDDALINKL